MWTASFFQTIYAVFSALAAILGFLIALRNFPKFVIWFKSQKILIAERNLAEARLLDMTGHATDARTAVKDVRDSLDSVRLMNDDLSVRLERLEKMRPIYDAAMMWTPKALAHIDLLEKMARANNLDMMGMSMPPLPNILIDYFKTTLGGTVE